MKLKMQADVTVIIADDHPIFRKGLKDIISESGKYSVIGESGDGGEVCTLVLKHQPDILLLDVNLPTINGLEVAKKLQDEKSSTKIIILTMHKEEVMFNQAMDAGVYGYVLKESASHDLLEALKTVSNNEYYISPVISSYLVKRTRQKESFHNEKPTIELLTTTERKILKLISEDKTSKVIADELFISLRTVENHRQNICNKLKIHGINALLKFAIEHKSTL